MKLKNRGNPCLQGKVKAMWSDTLAAPWSQHWGVCVQFAFVRFVISDPPTLLFHNQRVMFTTNFMPFYLVSWKWFYLTRRRKFVRQMLCIVTVSLFHTFTLNFLILLTTGKKSLSNLTYPLEQCDFILYFVPLPMVYDLVSILYCTSNICIPALAFSMWTYIHIIRICKCQCIKVKTLLWSEN